MGESSGVSQMTAIERKLWVAQRDDIYGRGTEDLSIDATALKLVEEEIDRDKKVSDAEMRFFVKLVVEARNPKSRVAFSPSAIAYLEEHFASIKAKAKESSGEHSHPPAGIIMGLFGVGSSSSAMIALEKFIAPVSRLGLFGLSVASLMVLLGSLNDSTKAMMNNAVLDTFGPDGKLSMEPAEAVK